MSRSILCALVLCAACSRGEVPAPSVALPSPSIVAPTPEPTPPPDSRVDEIVAPPPAPPIAEPASLGPIVAARAPDTFVIDGVLDEAAWASAAAVTIDHDYAGRSISAPATSVRVLWAPEALFLGFDASYVGELSAPDSPTDTDDDELYAYDVVEAFLDAAPESPDTYREIEFGPRGHFLDIAVDRSARPRGDTSWSSGMAHAARLDTAAHRFVIEARIPAAAFDRVALSAGDWRIGLFRITGHTPTPRAFLARFPTYTERPSFHVPDRFGVLRLVR